jgi:hypothetical protein
MDPLILKAYVAALMSAATINVIIPGIILAAMVGMFIWVLKKAQIREDFDASEFLRDEDNKLSSIRLFAFIAVSVHTWVIAIETMAGRITDNQMLIYAVTWSASLVLKGAVDKWNGTLPLTRDAAPK